jgi:hypothetical protein
MELDGNFELQWASEFNWHNWIYGVYQTKADVVATEQIGYRGIATRLRNQIDYSLFNLAHSDKAIVGKDNILFDEWYLNAWMGRTFIGEDFIDVKLHKLKMVQDTLRKLGTELIFILAPDKANFFEEKIPEYYKNKRYPQNNYSYLAKRSEDIKINYIDLNKYFLAIKDTCRFPLYPKSGIHWSYYGSFVALDTILHYIEAVKKINLNDITVESIEITNSPKHPDYDIGKNINLLFQIPQWEMAYPKLNYENNTDKPKPKMLVTGDSYYFNIYNYNFTEHLFSNNAFWYYANWVYPDCYKEPIEAADLDFRKEIEDKDIIVMMVTSRFMHNIDWLLVEKLFNIYYPGIIWKRNYDRRATIHVDHDYFYWLVEEAEKLGLSTNEKLNRDADYMLSIRNNTTHGKTVFNFVLEIENDNEWFEKVKHKAQNNNRTLRDQKILEGLYLVMGGSVEEDSIIEAVKEKDIHYYVNKIKNNSEWMKTIEEKALKNKVNIEEQIKLDAKWIMENKK